MRWHISVCSILYLHASTHLNNGDIRNPDMNNLWYDRKCLFQHQHSWLWVVTACITWYCSVRSIPFLVLPPFGVQRAEHPTQHVELYKNDWFVRCRGLVTNIQKGGAVWLSVKLMVTWNYPILCLLMINFPTCCCPTACNFSMCGESITFKSPMMASTGRTEKTYPKQAIKRTVSLGWKKVR